MSGSLSLMYDVVSDELSETSPLSPTPVDAMVELEETARLSPVTYLLVCCFAVSSWVAVQGLWVELPLLVQELPEGWALPSYLVIIIQVANIGPIVYGVAKSRLRRRLSESAAVGAIIAVGAGACLLLAFFWRRTTVVSGQSHSVALIALTGILALVDCTSSVVYLPFMAAFPSRYITAFYIGEGLSGLVPGLVGIAQGVGDSPKCVNKTAGDGDYSLAELVPVYPEPLFSVAAFFVVLFVIMCFSGIAFAGLTKLPRCRLEMTKTRLHKNALYRCEEAPNAGSRTEDTNDAPRHEGVFPETVGHTGELDNSEVIVYSDRRDDGHGFSFDAPMSLSLPQLVWILALTAWINAVTNGLLPSLQSYACLPYGHRAFNLAVKLSTIANPAACFLCYFRQLGSVTSIGSATLVASVISTYLVYLAAVSPTPPLQAVWTGQALVVSMSEKGILSLRR